MAKAYARLGQQLEQMIGSGQNESFLETRGRGAHGQKTRKEDLTPFNLVLGLRDSVYSAAVNLLKMADSSPIRQRANYQVYKLMLSNKILQYF